MNNCLMQNITILILVYTFCIYVSYLHMPWRAAGQLFQETHINDLKT
jgi:hypothetical protein